MSLINHLKKPIRDLLVRLSKKRVEAPKFANLRLKDCSALLLHFANRQTDLDEIARWAAGVQDDFKEIKIVIYSNKALSVRPAIPKLIFVSQDDFTMFGRINKKTMPFLGQHKVDILIGLNSNENRWCQHLISELPAHFKVGVQKEMKPSNYHFVLRINTSHVKISHNFELLMDYLKTMKIYQ